MSLKYSCITTTIIIVIVLLITIAILLPKEDLFYKEDLNLVTFVRLEDPCTTKYRYSYTLSNTVLGAIMIIRK